MMSEFPNWVAMQIFFYIHKPFLHNILSVFSHQQWFLRTLDMFAYTACFEKMSAFTQITQKFLSHWKCQEICWPCFSTEILCWALTHLCAGTVPQPIYMQVHAYVQDCTVFDSKWQNCAKSFIKYLFNWPWEYITGFLPTKYNNSFIVLIHMQL